ncbi:MAG TPA: tetratricopeptide repeat protein [Patescibacteria group bacterium]|nr:tetratricopeptide repeat protein [Patescibacteria group bacterium]
MRFRGFRITDWRILSFLALLCAGTAVYANSFLNSFHFDDIAFILENDAIKPGGSLGGIWHFWPTRFFGLLSFALTYRLQADAVFGYHFISVLLHILTAGLVLCLAYQSFCSPALNDAGLRRNAKPLALFAALLFLVHPIQTQAVNYIFQRVTILSTFLYLASLCLYIQAMRVIAGRPVAGRRYYGLSFTVAAVGMFTKETMFTLPLMIVLYHAYFLRPEQRCRYRYVVPFCCLLPVVPLTLLSTRLSWAPASDMQRFMGQPLFHCAQYLLTQFRVMITYVRLLGLPLHQNLDYDYPLSRGLGDGPTLISLGILCLILWYGLVAFRRSRVVSYGIFWFFITLLPESSVMPLLDVIVEHRLYLPMAGVSLLAAAGLYYALARKKPLIAIAAASSILITCAALSWRRNFIWKDEISLWSDVISKSPRKARPYNERALAYQQLRRYDAAVRDYTSALSLAPEYAGGYYNRGLAYQQQGANAQALQDYSRAIKINPGYMQAYYNRGFLFCADKKYDRAVLDFKRALRICPGCPGFAEQFSRTCEEGVRYYTAQLLRDPDSAQPYQHRGFIYYASGKYAEAVSDYSRALQHGPDQAWIHAGLAEAYYFLKDYTSAIASYEKAVALGYRPNPGFLELLKSLRK